MSYKDIALIIEDAIGLDPNSIGQGAIEKGIERRMQSSQSPDISVYLALLLQSSLEMSLLIEELVVPETWFFREEGVFDALRQLVKNEWAIKIINRPLDIACIPCSTGEEPYSVAMCLDELGLTKNQYNIDAIDISSVALARAREAIYSEVSFRNGDLSFRDKYFIKTDRTYKLKLPISSAVNFYHGNALLLPEEMRSKKYDVIFCRNLMIYLGNDKRKQLIDQLRDLLSETGMIVVGYSESRAMTDAGFDSLNYSQAFAFCHAHDKSHTNKRKKIRTNIKTEKLNKSIKRNASLSLYRNKAVLPRVPLQKKTLKEQTENFYQSKKQNHQMIIADAQQYSDKGDYAEALKVCNEYLRHHDSNTAPVLFLMAVIYEAQGNDESAENYFRKVIYLDPQHRDGLMHLSLLAEKKGDTERVNNIQMRLERIRKKDEMTDG